MIRFDARTGGVIWGEYELEPETLFDTFVHRYPQLSITGEQLDWAGPISRSIIELPELIVDTQRWGATIDFLNRRYISGISITSLDLETDNEPSEEWWDNCFRWIISARQLLVSQFGNSFEIRFPRLFDEDKLLKETQIRLLDGRCYTFRWGEAGITYESLDMWIGIWLQYDHFYQVKTWDELVVDAAYNMEFETLRHPKLKQSWLVAQQLIPILRPFVDYETYRPRLGAVGMTLKLSPTSATRLNIAYAPTEHRKYRLVHTARVGHIDVANDVELVDVVKQILGISYV
ncbi:MAG: hypothetical protein J0M07_14070 [Anaerolineae bacterium]|nr:hypothetical protein [Anaerolineae bacterium]